jgi:hypothetical protein
MGDSDVRTQHCECGSELYHVKWTFEGEVWAECAECGRRTSAFEDWVVDTRKP